MSPRTAIAPTCSAVAAVLVDPPDVDLDTTTPCADFDVRALVEHFVGTSAAMARIGLGQPLDPDNPWGGGDGAADGDWSARLRDNLDGIAQGWSQEEPWDGEVEVGDSTVPAPMLGEMALVEVAMHGWDLARALGRTVELDGDVAADVDAAVAHTAEMGRQMGAYGPEVEVGAEVTGLDRALARAGRDPSW